VIEPYLEELRRRLARAPGRARLLAEVEDHLREAAARLERRGASVQEAERAAVDAFGPPQQLAAALAGQQAAGAVGWSSRVLVVAMAGFVPVYGFFENFNPPAPWPSTAETPGQLAWKLAAAKYLLVGAAALGAVVFLLARGYRSRPGGAPRLARALALGALLIAAAAAAGGALGVVEEFERSALYREFGVADPLTRLELSLVAAWIALLALAALAAAAWSARLAFRLKPA
jgi:hypothetical protein